MQAPPNPIVDLPPLAAPPPRVKASTPRPPPPASLQPDSPDVFFTNAATSAPLGSAHRRIAIAVDLSDESTLAVSWAVANYLRPGDAVILLHVRPGERRRGQQRRPAAAAGRRGHQSRRHHALIELAAVNAVATLL